MLRRRRLNRRLHRLTALFVMLCDLLGDTWNRLTTDSLSVMDRCSMAVCDNDRIPRTT